MEETVLVVTESSFKRFIEQLYFRKRFYL